MGSVARASYRDPGEARVPSVEPVVVSLPKPYLEALRLLSVFVRKSSPGTNCSLQQYATQLLQGELITAFEQATGMTLGEFVRRVRAGERFDWVLVQKSDNPDDCELVLQSERRN